MKKRAAPRIAAGAAVLLLAFSGIPASALSRGRVMFTTRFTSRCIRRTPIRHHGLSLARRSERAISTSQAVSIATVAIKFTFLIRKTTV